MAGWNPPAAASMEAGSTATIGIFSKASRPRLEFARSREHGDGELWKWPVPHGWNSVVYHWGSVLNWTVPRIIDVFFFTCWSFVYFCLIRVCLLEVSDCVRNSDTLLTQFFGLWVAQQLDYSVHFWDVTWLWTHCHGTWFFTRIYYIGLLSLLYLHIGSIWHCIILQCVYIYLNVMYMSLYGTSIAHSSG